MQYNIKNEKELNNALLNLTDCATINLENDLTLQNPIEISGLKDIKIISQNGSELTGGIVTNKWEKEGDFLVFKTETEPRILIINGEIREKSTYPQNEYLQHLTSTELYWCDSKNGGWNRKPTMLELTNITVNTADIPTELDIENCDIRAIHIWDESTVAIKSYNSKTGEIITASPMEHPAGAFGVQSYKLINTKYGLNEKGTWCYDRKEKKIYYSPFEEESIDNIEAMVPVSKSVIKIKNCENVTVEGINIFLSNSQCGINAGLRAINPLGALQIENCKNVKIEKLQVSFSGGQGIKILKSSNVSVQNTVIKHCASGGIFTYECENELISHNNIEEVGMYDFSAIPIHAGGKSLLVYVVDGKVAEKGKTVIEHNIIDKTPYCGITCNGGPHVISNNKITRCMQKLNDGAAIYCSRANGTLVKENYISNLPPTKSYAIYFDELSENCVVDGNVSINVKKPFLNHIAKNCIFKNNIAINDEELIILMDTSTNFLWQQNILCSNGDIVFLCDNFDGEPHELSEYIKNDRDILFAKDGKLIYKEEIYRRQRCYEEIDFNCDVIKQDPGITIKEDKIYIKNNLNGIENKYMEE